MAFVFDYKAANKLTVDILKLALADENLVEVVRRIHSGTCQKDEALKERDEAALQIAMALTQVFDYMVLRGLEYDYVSAGMALVFFHIDRGEVQTLNYHLCAAKGGTKGSTGDEHIDLSKTAVAQLAGFCFFSLSSEPLAGAALERLSTTPKLQLWPEPYDEESGRGNEAGGADDPESSPSPQDTSSSFGDEVCRGANSSSGVATTAKTTMAPLGRVSRDQLLQPN